MLKTLGVLPPNKGVRAKSGSTPLSLLYCEQCVTNAPSACCDVLTCFPWIVQLHCVNDTEHPSWFICSECPDQRKHMFDKSKVKVHNKKFHFLSNKKPQMCTADDSTDYLSAEPPFESEIAPRSTTYGTILPSLRFNFTRPESSDYFINENLEHHGGAAYLVGNSTFGLKDIGKDLDSKEVELEVLIASLASTLSRNQRAKLSMILGRLVANIPKVQLKRDWSITVPTNPPMMRSRVMEGKTAILTNLPHPPVIKVGNGHAYVSLKDIVSDFLAHGTSYETIYPRISSSQGTSRIGESPYANSILERALQHHPTPKPLITLCQNEWADDFQVLKSNKGKKKPLRVDSIDF